MDRATYVLNLKRHPCPDCSPVGSRLGPQASRLLPVLAKLGIDVVDCCRDLFGGGFDAEELDQVVDHFLGVSGQFAEVDVEHGDFGMRGDEGVAVLEETALQAFAIFVCGGEPLASMLFGS